MRKYTGAPVYARASITDPASSQVTYRPTHAQADIDGDTPTHPRTAARHFTPLMGRAQLHCERLPEEIEPSRFLVPRGPYRPYIRPGRHKKRNLTLRFTLDTTPLTTAAVNVQNNSEVSEALTRKARPIYCPLAFMRMEKWTLQSSHAIFHEKKKQK
ncbi:hypothetical protein GCM10023324_54960 [Streptomyces youssoufiensis]